MEKVKIFILTLSISKASASYALVDEQHFVPQRTWKRMECCFDSTDDGDLYEKAASLRFERNLPQWVWKSEAESCLSVQAMGIKTYEELDKILIMKV